MTFRTHLSVAGFGLAAVYAVMALLALIVGGDPRGALMFLAGAAVTAGMVALLLPLLAPHRGDSGEDDVDGGSGGSGGDPPPPPWWPDFEREFWGHVDGGDRGRSGDDGRDRLPA